MRSISGKGGQQSWIGCRRLDILPESIHGNVGQSLSLRRRASPRNNRLPHPFRPEHHPPPLPWLTLPRGGLVIDKLVIEPRPQIISAPFHSPIMPDRCHGDTFSTVPLQTEKERKTHWRKHATVCVSNLSNLLGGQVFCFSILWLFRVTVRWYRYMYMWNIYIMTGEGLFWYLTWTCYSICTLAIFNIV